MWRDKRNCRRFYFTAKARKAIVGLVQHIRDEAQRRHWPKLYFFPIDEPGNNKTEHRYLFAENVLDFVHEVPGCETAVTVTSGCVQRLGKRVDVRIYAYGHYARDKVLKETEQGHPFWYYENGMFYAHSTLASRGNTGFELSAPLQRKLSTLGIALSFDVYDWTKEEDEPKLSLAHSS